MKIAYVVTERKRDMIIGFLLCLTLTLTAGVVEDWSRTFSPRHTAAISLTVLDQINVIRSKLPTPLPVITTNQMVTAMTAKYVSLKDDFYDIENPVNP